MKKSILLATSAIIASGAVAVNAQAVDVELYGQVNKGVMGYSVGNNDSEIAIVDNDVSSTRFGLRGEQQLDHGLTASALMEVEFNNDNASNLVARAGGAPADTNPAGFQERHARVGLAGQWGALFLGRTSSATDGITEIDLGPVADVLNSATDRIGGGLVAGGAGAPTVAQLTDNMDGIGYTAINVQDQHTSDRKNLIRFDTPIVEGFQGRVAYVQGGDVDASVLYNGKYDAFEIAAGIGMVSYRGADTPDTLANATMFVNEAYSGSVSVKHDSGVTLTGAYGTRTLVGAPSGMDNPTFWYAKAGYQMGNTGVAIDYAKHSNADISDAANETLNAYGIGIQQDLGHGVSASAYYRMLDVTDNGVATEEDVDLYGVNLRVKF